MPARVNNETWKRVSLWVVIVILSAIIMMGWKDYNYMDQQVRLMKHNFVADVVGYNYCDKD
jgi:hypothetical protein